MENREVVTTKKMTTDLIINWLAWGLIFGAIYSKIFSVISNSIESIVLLSIVAIALQGIFVYIVWKLCIVTVFKKRTISQSDVPIVIRNLAIFTIIICITSFIYNYAKIDKAINKAVDSQLKYSETLLTKLYSDSEMDEYHKKKEAEIAKAKKQAYTYLIILNIGLTAVCLAVLPLEKKEMLKQAS